MNALMHRPTENYAHRTTSMQVVPEALHRRGVASGSRSGAPTACAGRADLDWVPDREATIVPRLQRRLCRACPTRSSCLSRALETRSVGYWAGTTTADRKALTGDAGPSLTELDARQDQLARSLSAAAASVRAQALHATGEGDLGWYRRRGCRCPECRTANTSHRAAERARAASRAQVAA
jgi:hypothetical protein